ncbi:hypothetical protein QFC19_001596 [Naganishia cerealis]|uniref:Uncharacterized protein n=1 Tax=Naganishia cerealis TaxID=610337 RepID=A0ACC2WFE2_9TREE|nr:hypothetical protein QFC19_001596 [Naganishia cerealis]
MPAPSQTVSLEEFTARVQKAATAHSVNADEFGNNIYKTLKITGMDLEDEDGAGQQAGKPKRKKAKVIVETVVRKGNEHATVGAASDPSGTARHAYTASTAYIIDMYAHIGPPFLAQALIPLFYYFPSLSAARRSP